MRHVLAIAAACFAVALAAEASAAPPPVEVKLTDIEEQLVPHTLVSGDREFNGNGPRIICSATLYVTPDKRFIHAHVEFAAKETKPDWSKTTGEWTRTVYKAPAGKQIAEIVNGVVSKVDFESKPAGFQILAPTEDFAKFLDGFRKVSEALLMFGVPGAPPADTTAKQAMKSIAERVMAGTAYLKSEGNYVHLQRPASGPVQVFAIVGDTGGPDISTDDDPKDDTRVAGIKFKPLHIRLQ